MYVATGGTALFRGPNLVSENGFPDGGSGISLARGAQLRAWPHTAGSTEIRDNNGPGIAADVNSTVSLMEATINNNAGAGVQVLHMSVAEFLSGNTLEGNGGGPISCDSTSLVFGELEGLGKIKCK